LSNPNIPFNIVALWYPYPSEKYESQLGSLFPIYGKIKNIEKKIYKSTKRIIPYIMEKKSHVPNHQADIVGKSLLRAKVYLGKSSWCPDVAEPSREADNDLPDVLGTLQELHRVDA
jgi:hypothetical protein